MIKIAVCDDNQAICFEVEQMILDYGKTLDIPIELEVFNSGDDMLKFIKEEHSFDLIFLDIELGVTTGIDVGNTIREEFDDHISKIVFITAKQGYEEALFNIQPLNFLRKPIDVDKLCKCLDLAVKLLERENKNFEYKRKHENIKIQFKDILYFEKVGRKIHIVTSAGVDVFNDTISNVKTALPQNFVQPHESFLVNYQKISSFNSKIILMVNKTEIPISRGKLSAVRAMLLKSVKEEE